CVATDCVAIIVSLLMECVAGGAQGEFQRFAGNALDERTNRPAEAGGDGAREGNRFVLHVQAAVSLLVGPVRVEPPEEAVLLGGSERVLITSTGRVNFRNLRAARDAVS